MNQIKEGIEYELKNFNTDKVQTVKFTEKIDEYTFSDGTTNEEVINMLIERFYYFQRKNFCVENQIIVTLLKDIRKLLAKRNDKKRKSLARY